MRILIIEDEKKIASIIKKGLTEENYVVDIAESGEESLKLIQSVDYDLLILDVMLPGKDGWAVISEVRNAGLQIPVLFLTARDAVNDRQHAAKHSSAYCEHLFAGCLRTG